MHRNPLGRKKLGRRRPRGAPRLHVAFCTVSKLIFGGIAEGADGQGWGPRSVVLVTDDDIATAGKKKRNERAKVPIEVVVVPEELIDV